MQFLLAAAYLRVFLLVLLNSYFVFILVAYIYDRALDEYCRRVGLSKPARFIFGTYVTPAQHQTMLKALSALPPPASTYARWLRIWLFFSWVFFLLTMLFLWLGVASLVTHHI